MGTASCKGLPVSESLKMAAFHPRAKNPPKFNRLRWCSKQTNHVLQRPPRNVWAAPGGVHV